MLPKYKTQFQQVYDAFGFSPPQRSYEATLYILRSGAGPHAEDAVADLNATELTGPDRLVLLVDEREFYAVPQLAYDGEKFFYIHHKIYPRALTTAAVRGLPWAIEEQPASAPKPFTADDLVRALLREVEDRGYKLPVEVWTPMYTVFHKLVWGYDRAAGRDRLP